VIASVLVTSIHCIAPIDKLAAPLGIPPTPAIAAKGQLPPTRAAPIRCLGRSAINQAPVIRAATFGGGLPPHGRRRSSLAGFAPVVSAPAILAPLTRQAAVGHFAKLFGVWAHSVSFFNGSALNPIAPEFFLRARRTHTLTGRWNLDKPSHFAAAPTGWILFAATRL